MTRFTPRPSAIGPAPALALIQRLWPDVDSLQPLSGGFSNANFSISKGRVVRFVAAGHDGALREAAVMARVREAGIACPRVLECRQVEGHSLLVLEYLEGRPLTDHRGHRAYEQLGRLLSALHNITFAAAGHFDSHGQWQPWPDHFVDGLTSGYLVGRSAQRLGPNLTEQVRSLLQRQPFRFSDRVSLVHCDFNPKNVLINQGKVWLLDWEFAMAGEPLIDLGNFFRFENDYRPIQKQAFLEGYGPLPPDWRESALMHDLVSLLDLLDSPLELPETFATARSLVEETLARIKNHGR